MKIEQLYNDRMIEKQAYRYCLLGIKEMLEQHNQIRTKKDIIMLLDAILNDLNLFVLDGTDVDVYKKDKDGKTISMSIKPHKIVSLQEREKEAISFFIDLLEKEIRINKENTKKVDRL